MLAFTSAAIGHAVGAKGATSKQADFKAWAGHICATALAGSSQKDRRHLFWTLLVEPGTITNWLTQAKPSTWYDAKATTSTVEHAFESRGGLT